MVVRKRAGVRRPNQPYAHTACRQPTSGQQSRDRFQNRRAVAPAVEFTCMTHARHAPEETGRGPMCFSESNPFQIRRIFPLRDGNFSRHWTNAPSVLAITAPAFRAMLRSSQRYACFCNRGIAFPPHPSGKGSRKSAIHGRPSLRANCHAARCGPSGGDVEKKRDVRAGVRSDKLTGGTRGRIGPSGAQLPWQKYLSDRSFRLPSKPTPGRYDKWIRHVLRVRVLASRLIDSGKYPAGVAESRKVFRKAVRPRGTDSVFGRIAIGEDQN